jgi:hypothetical protein
MHRPEDIKDKLQSSIRHQPNLKPCNFCVPGILSKCGAGTTWAEQRLCRFAVKSDFANRCMYYIPSMDGHCDCMDAQKNAQIIVED